MNDKRCKVTDDLEQLCMAAIMRTQHLFVDADAAAIKYESKLKMEDGKKYKVKVEISLDKDE